MFTRGLFRLWIVATALWIGFVVVYTVTTWLHKVADPVDLIAPTATMALLPPAGAATTTVRYTDAGNRIGGSGKSGAASVRRTLRSQKETTAMKTEAWELWPCSWCRSGLFSR